jgi:hypothetical protein
VEDGEVKFAFEEVEIAVAVEKRVAALRAPYHKPKESLVDEQHLL